MKLPESIITASAFRILALGSVAMLTSGCLSPMVEHDSGKKNWRHVEFVSLAPDAKSNLKIAFDCRSPASALGDSGQTSFILVREAPAQTASDKQSRMRDGWKYPPRYYVVPAVDALGLRSGEKLRADPSHCRSAAIPAPPRG